MVRARSNRQGEFIALANLSERRRPPAGFIPQRSVLDLTLRWLPLLGAVTASPSAAAMMKTILALRRTATVPLRSARIA